MNEISYPVRKRSLKVEVQELSDQLTEMDINDNYEIVMRLFQVRNIIQSIMDKLPEEDTDAPPSK